MPIITDAEWDYDKAAHLLLRAGFGHNGIYNKRTREVTLVRRLANKTPAEAVDFMVNFPVSRARGPNNLKGGTETDFPRLQRWWLLRMKNTTKPLREKMTLFLHAHFATGGSKVDHSRHMADQNRLFRESAAGDFRELLKRVNVDAAMLIWLDGKLNRAGSLNENYGRELQELFALGVYDFAGERNYAQNDVVEAARILTGWTESHDNRTITVEFRSSRHDSASKTMFAPVPGETPNQNPANQFTVGNLGDQEHAFLVDKLFDHVDTEGRPTAARYIARKMWKFFAYDPEVDAGTARADLALIDALADEFKNSGYNLGVLLRAMFLRSEFYADVTRTVKSPVEFVVGSLRMLRGKLSGYEREVIGSETTRAMGQELFEPPDVFSWRGNLAWITTQTFLKRYEFARNLATGEKSRFYEIGFKISPFLDPNEVGATRQSTVDRFLKLLGPLTVDSATNAQLVAWLGPDDVGFDAKLLDESYLNTSVRGLVNLILTLPQYHTH